MCTLILNFFLMIVGVAGFVLAWLAYNRPPKKGKKMPKDDPTARKRRDDDDESVTLSGVLNAIVGAFAPGGRVLIMPSNYPERLDEALARPRGPPREVHQPAGPDVGHDVPEFLPRCAIAHRQRPGLSPAELQGMLLEHPDDAEAAAAAITKRAA